MQHHFAPPNLRAVPSLLQDRPPPNPYEPPKPTVAGAQSTPQPHSKRWREEWSRRQESDGKGQRGAAKELHKVPVKQLTPEVGEEITRTAPQLPAKGEDARGDTPPPPPVSAACAQADARAAGGRAARGEQRGHVPTEPPASPTPRLPSGQPCPIASGQGTSLWTMAPAALMPLLSRIRGSFWLSSACLPSNVQHKHPYGGQALADSLVLSRAC